MNPPNYDESGVGDYSGGAHYEYEYVEDAVYADDDEDSDHKRRRKRQAADREHHKDHQMHMHSDYYEEDESGGEESVQLLCCSFQKYLHCSESVVNDTCGYDTAKFTKSFLDRMSGPLIQVTPGRLLTKIIMFLDAIQRSDWRPGTTIFSQ